jgi:hypothetical protein
MMNMISRDRCAPAIRTLFSGALLILLFGPGCAGGNDRAAPATEVPPDSASASPPALPDDGASESPPALPDEDVSVVAQGRAFASPEEGTRALIAALKPLNTEELRAILGPDGDEIVSSGDAVEDRTNAEAFVERYQRRHNIVVDGDTATLVVDEDEWPMPIPLVRSGASWHFDTEEGKDEILARRIGRNELSTIEACRALVDAQREYSAMQGSASDGQPIFAQKFLSDPGQKNGLYWQTKEGEPSSPLGPLFAEAVLEGYGSGTKAGEGGPRPFHGYCYRMLTSQGPWASGGARDYLVNGRMTGGFAVVAWPIEYGNSGITTFLVNNQAVVYQKDLGDETESLAAKMTAFNPDESWKIVP